MANEPSPKVKKLRQRLYRGVEQLAARWAHNPKVGGSSPPSATKRDKSRGLSFLFSFSCRNSLWDILCKMSRRCLLWYANKPAPNIKTKTSDLAIEGFALNIVGMTGLATSQTRSAPLNAFPRVPFARLQCLGKTPFISERAFLFSTRQSCKHEAHKKQKPPILRSKVLHSTLSG